MSPPTRPEDASASTDQPTPPSELRLPWLGEGRPRVVADRITGPFWEEVRHGRLSIQRCDRCEAAVFPPRPRCPHCLIEGTLAWSRAGRTGRVYSFAVAHYQMVPGFVPPYAAVVVELDDPAGVRLLSHVQGTTPDELHIGMSVALAAPTEGEGVSCLVFRAS